MTTAAFAQDQDPPRRAPLKRRRVLSAGMIGAALLLAGCWLSDDTVTRNIRVVVQAEIAGEIVAGSAVMGIRWAPGDNGRMYIKSNAEAVILDLPGRGTVYVLNAWMSENDLSNVSYWPYLVLRTFGMNGNGRVEDFPKLRALEGRYPVRPSDENPLFLPVMVALKDEAKRETLYRVQPAEFADLFGADVRYVGMWFEFTEAEPTAFIPERLPVALKPNESFYSAFPQRDENDNLIAVHDYAFPQKFTASAFFDRSY